MTSLQDHGDVCPTFVVITDEADQASQSEARRLGALDVFIKPFVLEDLRRPVWRRQRAAGARPGARRAS